MAAALLTIALLLAFGWPLSILLDRDARLPLRLATSFLLGAALAGFMLFLFSALQIRWSRGALLAALAIVAMIGGGLALRRGPRSRLHVQRPVAAHWPWFASKALDSLTAILAAGYALFATMGPTAEYDFIGIWGVKAREFWYAGAIDWRFLQNPFNEFAHVDYPILLPLIFDVQTLIRGAWDPRWLGALHVAFGVAALLSVRAFLQEETENQLLVAAGTLALVPVAFSPWIGLAEGPLVAGGTVGLLYVRRGTLQSNAIDVLRGAAFLGIAGSFKNEGLALIFAVAAGLLICAPRFVVRLWPAVVIVTPWILLRTMHHLQTDLTTSGILSRAAARLAHPQPILVALATYTTGKPFFWLGVALALVLAFRRLLTRERFLFATLLVQVGFFLTAYVITPHDVTWHVRWSWERIISQITLPLAFVAIALLVPLLDRERPAIQPTMPPTMS